MLVSQVLNSKSSDGVVSVTSSAKVSEAAAVLADKGIGTVLVSDDNGLTAVGILSERDIVRELARSGGGCLDKSVGDYMTRDLITCTAEANVEDVLAQMTERRFRHMPVVAEGDRLVGIVTLGDVVKAQMSRLAMEKDALQGMIMGH